MTPHDDPGSAVLRFMVKFRIIRLLKISEIPIATTELFFDKIAETRGLKNRKAPRLFFGVNYVYLLTGLC
jgi:hypothetical protein